MRKQGDGHLAVPLQQRGHPQGPLPRETLSPGKAPEVMGRSGAGASRRGRGAAETKLRTAGGARSTRSAGRGSPERPASPGPQAVGLGGGPAPPAGEPQPSPAERPWDFPHLVFPALHSRGKGGKPVEGGWGPRPPGHRFQPQALARTAALRERPIAPSQVSAVSRR